MLPGEYRYPEALYCEGCDQDVSPAIVWRDALVAPRDGGAEIRFDYQAAVCPLCGQTLCERDYDYQLIKAVNGGKT